MEIIASAVRHGDATTVAQNVQSLVDQGAPAQEILDRGLFVGMGEVGELFREEDIFMPEVIMAAKAMQAGVDILEPLLIGDGRRSKGRVVLGTVKGDLHDLGKNLVGLMFRGAGYEVLDLGVDVSADRFVAAVRDHQPDVLGMSALLTTTMLQMKQVIEALTEAGLRDRVQVVIGGCVIDQAFADRIGADAYADNAGEAVSKVNSFGAAGRFNGPGKGS
jgi:5-methyltetrahydrofolate--homocysteine methyltransferase